MLEADVRELFCSDEDAERILNKYAVAANPTSSSLPGKNINNSSYLSLLRSDEFVKQQKDRQMIIYANYNTLSDGLSIIAKKFIFLLRKRGFLVCSFHYSLSDHQHNTERIRALISALDIKPIFVFHGTFDSSLKNFLSFVRMMRIYTIGHLTWETTLLPDKYVDTFSAFDEIVVPSEFNLNVFRKSLKRKISVIRHLFDEYSLTERRLQEKFSETSDCIIFYTINNSNDRRKNFTSTCVFTIKWILRLRRLNPRQKFQFIVKGFEGECMKKLKDWTNKVTHGFSFVQFIDRDVKDEEIIALHERGHIYVSLTHGEGVGMSVIQACLHGNAVVAPSFGGYVEYIGNDYPFLVKCEVRNIGTLSNYSAPPFLQESIFHDPQQWCFVDEDAYYEILDLLNMKILLEKEELLERLTNTRRYIKYITNHDRIAREFLKILVT